MLNSCGNGNKEQEHQLVFNCCLQSTTEMLNTMPLRHQKHFLRRVGDEVHGAKILTDLKERQAAEWDLLRDTSEEIL